MPRASASQRAITSRANPLFKSLVKLAQSARERRKSGKTLLDGVHLIEAYRAMVGEPVMLIASPRCLVRAEIATLYTSRVNSNGIILDEPLFAELSPVETPSGILALIDRPAIEPRKAGSALLLEAIQDPGNLGAILRSAAAAGFSRILLSHDCADAWAPKTLRAGMGAHFALAIEEHVDLAQRISSVAPKVFALSVAGELNLFETDLSGELALLFGNEGAGLTRELEALADKRLYIPMQSAIESLNVAAAVSICCFEKLRQEQQLAPAGSRHEGA